MYVLEVVGPAGFPSTEEAAKSKFDVVDVEEVGVRNSGGIGGEKEIVHSETASSKVYGRIGLVLGLIQPALRIKYLGYIVGASEMVVHSIRING